MAANKRVIFDAFPDSPLRYREYDAVVCVDVIGVSTALVTAVAAGRRALLAESADRDTPLLEAVAAGRPGDPFRLRLEPGTLLANAQGCAAAYVACFRNAAATAEAVAARHARVAVLAACAAGRMCCEDQMAAAAVIAGLTGRGFEPADGRTAEMVRRWASAGIALVRWGNGAEELRRAGRLTDLEFIVARVDDLDTAHEMAGSEIRAVSARAKGGVPSAAGETDAETALSWPPGETALSLVASSS